MHTLFCELRSQSVAQPDLQEYIHAWLVIHMSTAAEEPEWRWLQISGKLMLKFTVQVDKQTVKVIFH